MFYDIIANQAPEDRDDYYWEYVDGRPRCSWYRQAEHVVFVCCVLDDNDELYEKDTLQFLEPFDWVYRNDVDAFVYLLSQLVSPVSDSVKNWLIQEFQVKEMYNLCALINEHLRSYSVSNHKAIFREREKVEKRVYDFIDSLEQKSESLNSLKKHAEENGGAKQLQGLVEECCSVYRIETTTSELSKSLSSLDWFLEQYGERLLQRLVEKEHYKEIVDQLIDVCMEREYYALCSFIQKNIKIRESDNYWKFTPLRPTQKEEVNGLLGIDDEDDEEEE